MSFLSDQGAIVGIYDQITNLPPIAVPAPKDKSATIDVPDVSQWQTWLNPPSTDSNVAHEDNKGK